MLKPLFFPPVSALLPVFHFCKYSHGKADENKKRFYGICFCFINKSIAPSGWLVFQRGFKQLKRVSSPSFTAVYLVCIKTRWTVFTIRRLEAIHSLGFYSRRWTKPWKMLAFFLVNNSKDCTLESYTSWWHFLIFVYVKTKQVCGGINPTDDFKCWDLREERSFTWFSFSCSKILEDVINAEETLRPAEALEMCGMLEIINLWIKIRRQSVSEKR